MDISEVLVLFDPATLDAQQERDYEVFVDSFDPQIRQEVASYLEKLVAFSGPMVFNPWRDQDPDYDIADAPKKRRQNFMAYFLPRIGRASHMIVAEAVGYQGGRFTGIAITCERMLLGYHHAIESSAVAPLPLWRTSDADSPHIAKGTQKDKGFNEPTDTVVWSAMVEAGINTYDSILWNIFPFHPHKSKAALTNRTPSEGELAIGWDYMKDLLDLHQTCAALYQEGASYPMKEGVRMDQDLPGSQTNPILAVGRKCAGVLEAFGIPSIALRHPANGGASEYRRNFMDAIRNKSL